MAVIINGDTGIDKIVDGSIVAADIGAGEVGATQLASTLDLSGKTVTLPAGVGGKILQVVQDTKTDTFSTNTTSFVDVTGLSVSITPSSASSKILVLVTMQIGNNASHYQARLMRDATAIAVGDSAGSRIQTTMHGSSTASLHVETKSTAWLDSPATTSSVTYKMQIRVNNASYYATVNRSYTDTNDAYQGRTVSTITVMEVAG